MITIRQNKKGTFNIESDLEMIPINVAEEIVNQAITIVLSQHLSVDDATVSLAKSYKRLKVLNFIFYAIALIFILLYFLEVRK